MTSVVLRTKRATTNATSWLSPPPPTTTLATSVVSESTTAGGPITTTAPASGLPVVESGANVLGVSLAAQWGSTLGIWPIIMGWGILGGWKDFIEAEGAADREAAIRQKRKDKKALTGNANAAIAAIVAQFVRPNLGCATLWCNLIGVSQMWIESAGEVIRMGSVYTARNRCRSEDQQVVGRVAHK
ncbi:hypothetical protein PG990_000089 [Apiospora arundinis]